MERVWRRENWEGRVAEEVMVILVISYQEWSQCRFRASDLGVD